DELVPVEQKYKKLSGLARGSIDLAKPLLPDPNGFYYFDADSGEMEFDHEKYGAAVRETLPSWEETRSRVRDETRAWLNDRSDADLDRIGVWTGNPHFTTLPRDAKIVMLDHTIPRAAKAHVENHAYKLWFAAGNHRYGPPG